MSQWQISLIWFWRNTVVPEGKVIFWLVLVYWIFSELSQR